MGGNRRRGVKQAGKQQQRSIDNRFPRPEGSQGRIGMAAWAVAIVVFIEPTSYFYGLRPGVATVLTPEHRARDSDN